MMYKIFILVLLTACIQASAFSIGYKDNHIQYEPVRLSEAERKILRESLDKQHEKYDPKEQMITKTLNAWNYHTDAETGIFHEVRASFSYAVGLLDLGDPQYEQRAFDIIRKTITLQDTISANKTCGIWPYYLEEPLATKKSPADWNWADFNGVSLLDVYMGHQDKLPADLKATIRTSLIYAARSIQKRDVQPGYTNIAIMGTYVTYLVSHLFDLPDMQTYATNRLQKFYDYTLQRGFTEYNSPTYTIVALDELDRMKRHIIDKDAKPKIDRLYRTGWEIIAKHYHKPSGQWAGPHSRSYSTLLTPSVTGVFKQASGGKIDLPGAMPRPDVKIKHRIPADLLPYFLAPKYPRTQTDNLTTDEPKIIGTTYLTDQYALSSANRSNLWNQRRPFLVYWGTPASPHYLQVRVLHDLYDFSAAAFYSEQKENSILAGINFMTNGGDKHINIDKLKDGKFTAKDLRLRFEFGHVPPGQLAVPGKVNEPFSVHADGLDLSFQLFHAAFGDYKGHWEKGGDGNVSWIDYVIYSGENKELNLSSMEDATLGFTFGVNESKAGYINPVVSNTDNTLQARWKGMRIEIPGKPAPQPKNL